MKKHLKSILLLFVLVVIFYSCSDKQDADYAEDAWCSYMHDQKNSGVSTDKLVFPLNVTWERKLMHEPIPAWPAPAKQDYYNGKGKLEPLVTYDRAYHPVIVQGKLFIASSATNSIICFDAYSGEKVWQFYTDGPNRNAPLWHKGKLYFGSDDGNLYCLSAEKGTLEWKKQFGSARKLIGNGRLISAKPIRTGIAAKGDTIFLASGLLPEEEVSVVACNAFTGEIFWKHELNDLAPQGYPVLSDSIWYVPNSRVQPVSFSFENGERSQKVGGLGGDYVTLVDDKLIHGINWQGEIKARNFLEAAMTGYKVVGNKDRLYIATDFSLNAVDVNEYLKIFPEKEKLENELKSLSEQVKTGSETQLLKIDSLRTALNKAKESEFLWQQETQKNFCMIKTANAVIVGQQNQVIAYNEQTGEKVWKQEVVGRAYGLAVCDAKLYVSTDKGYLYCFGNGKRNKTFIEEANKNVFRSTKNKQKTEEWANKIKQCLPREKGILLLPEITKGERINALAKVCGYYIIGLADNEKELAQIRGGLDEAGIYGVRSAIFSSSIEELNLSDYLVNAVVIDDIRGKDDLSAVLKQVARILAPSGGRLLLTREVGKEEADKIFNDFFAGYSFSESEDYWIIERNKLPGSGEWTHLYANSANTVSTGDVYASDDVKPLWFGQPGPREMSDRHHRAPAPLFNNGILYIPKDNGIIAADAYNGTLLWNKDIPHFRRIKISRDAGNMALASDVLYAVADNFCYVIDPVSGEEQNLFRVPFLQRQSTDPHWGYVATSGDMLFGSARKHTAIFNQYSRLDWSEYSRLVTSDYLFGLNRKSGKTKWLYKGGIILNPTICVGNGEIFFVESNSEEALNDEDGLIPFNTFKKKLKIVALNAENGELIWEKAFDFQLIEHILFGSYSDDVLLLSGSGNKNGGLWYGSYAFDANTGQKMWVQEKQHLGWTNGSHGEQIHRAMIMAGTVFTEPFAFDLKTGEQKDNWKLQRNGHSCGNISGAGEVIYFRGTNPSVCLPNETDQGKKLNNITRPGCWINMIPAGGLLLIPEASSGCSCNFPLQMSIVYQPVSKN